MARELVINANVYDFGTDAGAWRVPGTSALDNLTPEFWSHIAGVAERGGLDGIFLADMPGLSASPALRPNRLVEPLATLGTVLSATTHLGAIATVSTSANDPVELTQRLLTYHALAGGRFGWNLVTGVPTLVSRDFGFETTPSRSDRYGRAIEFLAVYRSYVGAVVRGGVFEHRGTHFRYPAQRPADDVPAFVAEYAAESTPLVVQAGGSTQGRDLAARTADAVFAAEMVPEVSHDNRMALRVSAADLGRRPPLVLPGIHVVLGSTRSEAEARFELVNGLGPEGYVLRRLTNMLGLSADAVRLDDSAVEQLEAVGAVSENASLGFRASTISYARARGLTMRQLIHHFSGFGHQFFVGTPAELVDIMQLWSDEGAADGFNILFDANPTGLELFADEVMPLLRARGLARADAPDVPFADRLRSAER